MLSIGRCGAALVLASMAIAGCGNSSGGASSAGSSPAVPQAATSPAGMSQTASFTDLSGVFGAEQIVQLAQLGVFESNSGTFDPGKPITRAEFVRWLVEANNAIWANDASKVIRTSSAAASVFPDVSTSHVNFPYIQGMYDAGFAIGFSDKLFHPDDPLTHEQMLAIKESVDRGGIDKYYEQWWDSTMPDWKDRVQIDKRFRAAIAEDSSFDRHYPDVAVGNIGRAFGAIAMLRPRQPVTRAEAAACIWKIGAHNESTGAAGMPRSAADALKPSPAPSST